MNYDICAPEKVHHGRDKRISYLVRMVTVNKKSRVFYCFKLFSSDDLVPPYKLCIQKSEYLRYYMIQNCTQ